MDEVKKILQSNWDISGLENGIISCLVGDIDLNFNVKTEDRKYILKLQHPDNDPEHLRAQNQVLDYLQGNFKETEVPFVIPTISGDHLIEVSYQGLLYQTRLLSWVEGVPLGDCHPISNSLVEEIGQALGSLTSNLDRSNIKFPGRVFSWDINQFFEEFKQWPSFDTKLQKTIDFFVGKYKADLEENKNELSWGPIHGDANDYNIMASLGDDGLKLAGIIDFGDLHESFKVCEVANAIAYLAMDKWEPLECACHTLQGFNRKFILNEADVKVLYSFVAMRLVISLAHSTREAEQSTTNEYKLISQDRARELLFRWREIHPAWAWYKFRSVLGLEPYPGGRMIKKSISDKKPYPIIDLSNRKVQTVDLSLSSTSLGHPRHYGNADVMNARIDQLMNYCEADVLIGGYLEYRPIYNFDRFKIKTDDGFEYRCVHLGQDIWSKAGTPVYAPFDGNIYLATNRKDVGDYGGLIILEHNLAGNTFYTLYGHLSADSIKGKRKGDKVYKGKEIATLGAENENGGWTPHLHFQLILDMLGQTDDFKGVALHRDYLIFQSLCPDPGLITGYTPSSQSNNYEKVYMDRKNFFSSNLSLSYEKPLLIEKAYKQELIDYTGRRYLDTVNNVPHVGHQHEHVVDAGQKQMELLNTNSRYLFRSMNQYAELLLSKFPGKLNTVFFVNSGSEANELAMRMANMTTGRHEMISLEMAYHGNTSRCIDVSSYKFDREGGGGCPANTFVLGIPEMHYGKVPIAYPTSIDQVLAEMNQKGSNPAAFIGESILSCAGQWELDTKFVNEIYSKVRKAGGLIIADEVQVGFGRVGDTFWGFELYGVVPDIVTLGKPMGNGHPLGAVITTREIARKFSNGMEYFNTYGGNAVSCEIGKAVLEVIESEGLQENAKETGKLLRDGWEKLKVEYPAIGSIRGRGLFTGFELVENGVPATQKAAYFVNRMKDKGILMSTDGPYNNIIKVKPPMCFNSNDAGFLLEQMSEVLRESFMG